MKENVRIKSFQKGLILQLGEEPSFDEILAEATKKFSEGRAFFGDAAVAVTFQGRELSRSEELQLVDAIQQNCDLKVICVVAKDEEQNKLFVKAVQYTERQRIADTVLGEDVQVFRGDLTEGEKLDTPSSIIILGDVRSGCSVVSAKNIMIVGSLYGEAHAGYGENGEGNFVIALEMTPEALTIGDFKYISPKKTMWGKKKKEQMLVAKLQEDKVQIQEFTKELLSAF